jgi:hypothetical protein
MPVFAQGSINTTALIVPDLYVQIVSPQTLLLNGVPTDTLGVVGSATWGPVGEPTICGSMGDYAAAFGPVMPRKYDMGTQVATAVQQGAANFRCVRVTDGTDTAAALSVFGAITFTALHTGTLGNQLTLTFSAGSAANSWRVTIALPGINPEVFDNILGSGAVFWANLAYAGLNAAALVGSDSLPRQGMYALRGQGCAMALLADADDASHWSAQVAFGLSESVYMICTGPAGDNITNAVATKAGAGIDSYAAKLMFGDWIYWYDQANALTRLVSPQGFVAGRLANLSPEQSSLNKPLYGVIGSQKSGQPGVGTATTYATADLSALLSAGIDVIANPQPGGAYWGVRGGFNTSSNAAINGDNYTRLTNYIAATLSSGMGIYVGQLVNATLFQNIRATLLAFLNGLLGQGLLGSTDGSLPFAVVCDITNNPVSRTSLGYVQADVQVQYQAINEKFIVNVQGGQTVQVSVQSVAASS